MVVQRFMARSMAMRVWGALVRFIALFMAMQKSHIVQRSGGVLIAMQQSIQKAKQSWFQKIVRFIKAIMLLRLLIKQNKNRHGSAFFMVINPS